MLFSVEQAFVGREEIRAPLKTPAWEASGPQVGEVICGGLPHLTCKRDYIKMRDYMDRRVTPPNRVTSPIWGTPPPCKQALRLIAEQANYPKVHEKLPFFV